MIGVGWWWIGCCHSIGGYWLMSTGTVWLFIIMIISHLTTSRPITLIPYSINSSHLLFSLYWLPPPTCSQPISTTLHDSYYTAQSWSTLPLYPYAPWPASPSCDCSEWTWWLGPAVIVQCSTFIVTATWVSGWWSSSIAKVSRISIAVDQVIVRC